MWDFFKFETKKRPALSITSGSASSAKLISDHPKILIFKLDHIGDFVTALEGFWRIRNAWPEAKITLVCAPANVPFAEKLQIFDTIIPFAFFPSSREVKIGQPIDTKTKFREFSKLNLGYFDIAIDLRHDGDTRPLLLHVEALFRAGYTSDSLTTPLDISLPELEYNARTSRKFLPLHAETRLTLLAELVIMTLKLGSRSFVQPLSTGDQKPAEITKEFIIFSLASGAPIRKWPLERVKSLITRLISATGYLIVFVGGAEDSEDIAFLINEMPIESYVNLVGSLQIADLPPILAKASLLIGYDTGVSHLSAYMGTPTLVIYGAIADKNVWMPRGAKVTVLNTEVPCSPCYLREIAQCNFERICLTSISVDDVFNSAISLLSDQDVLGVNHHAI